MDRICSSLYRKIKVSSEGLLVATVHKGLLHRAFDELTLFVVFLLLSQCLFADPDPLRSCPLNPLNSWAITLYGNIPFECPWLDREVEREQKELGVVVFF
jgi:hypothetical protein